MDSRSNCGWRGVEILWWADGVRLPEIEGATRSKFCCNEDSDCRPGMAADNSSLVLRMRSIID